MGTVKLPTLTGKRVVLRPPRASDVAERLKLGAHAEIVRMYGGSVARLGAMTEAAARRWVQDLVDHDYAWVIEADALIGLVRLDRVDLVDRRASLAIGIEDPARLGSRFRGDPAGSRFCLPGAQAASHFGAGDRIQ